MARHVKLFEPVTFRSVTARNRIVVAPMCQYCATDGVADDWHVQHLGSRAAGGAGIVFTEATHVSALGRITPGCLGLYNDAQTEALARVVRVIEMGGAVPAIQVGHSGRKGSVTAPWLGATPVPESEGGWQTWAPSSLAFGPANVAPHAMTEAEIAEVVSQFVNTARLSLAAGFKILELHAAHGYLVHSFLSPISNTRTDGYGGDLAGRSRILFEIIDAVRAVWPEELPLFVRLSCVDWMEGGLTLADTTEIARRIKATGKIDLIDCSSGGIAAVGPVIPSLYPGYQVRFAEALREGAGIATGAVGLITAPEHAAEIVANDRADLVFIARAILGEPSWPLRAAAALGAEIPLLPQYLRATVSPR